MNPDNHHQPESETAMYVPATSPWTELYQNATAPSQQAEYAASAFNSDDQRPTHDALSDIYNRVYQ
jgi:hypothetical protein